MLGARHAEPTTLCSAGVRRSLSTVRLAAACRLSPLVLVKSLNAKSPSAGTKADQDRSAERSATAARAGVAPRAALARMVVS